MLSCKCWVQIGYVYTCFEICKAVTGSMEDENIAMAILSLSSITYNVDRSNKFLNLSFFKYLKILKANQEFSKRIDVKIHTTKYAEVRYNKFNFIGTSDLTFIFSWYNWPYYVSHAQGLKNK